MNSFNIYDIVILPKDLYLPSVKLQSLQIKGFKSFANETTIHFNDEITGIIGPNGSGKSNIVDAIRWVLGEQKSKDLRLDKMVDVIFNGTKSKRKASMAQVTMTFENSKKLIPLEYDSVQVSRILYANNDSEYRLNDVPCRLKDIRNLFLDTGIGSNSYAIIELGMVDDILMDKDNARRRMFEQAAGISKYKVRKKETLNKLKNTQTDLDRIEDILFELQVNIKSLEKQAKRTKKYYELKEEYKELSIRKTAINQKEALAQEKRFKAQILEANESYNESSKSIHELEAEIEKIKKANLDKEQLLSAKQKDFNDVIDTIRKSENLMEIKKQNQIFIQQNIKRASNNIEEFENSIKDIKTVLEQKQAELKSKESNTALLKSDFEEWKEKFAEIEVERQRIQGESSSELEELKNLENKRFELEKTLIELKSQSANAEQNEKRTNEEIATIQASQATLIKDLESINSDISAVQEDIKQLNFKLENLEEEKQRINNLLQTEKENLIVSNRKLDAFNNEYNLLKDMIDNLEGFPESAKFLSKNWSKTKPLLSDIIECQEEYRSAIESYLDPYLSYFVLDSVDEARESIDLLKKAQKGKSQFFILSSFDNYDSNQINLSQYGKAAINVVKADSKYDSLLHHLLYNVVIVDDNELLNETLPDDNLTYLSTSGSANRTKHAISGGSVGLFDGKRIGRQKEVEKLKSRIETTKQDISNIELQIADYNSKIENLVTDQLKTELQKKEASLRHYEIRKAEVDTKINNSNNIVDSLKLRINQYNSIVNENLSLIKNITADVEESITQIHNKKAVVDNQSGMIEHISKNYGEINSKFNTAQLEWVKHNNEIQSIQNEVQFRNQQISELMTKIDSSKNETLELDISIIENQKIIENVNKKLFEEYKIRDTKKAELNETEQLFFSTRNVISEKEDSLRSLNRKLQNQQLTINELKDKLTGVEFELRSALERLKIEFNIDLKSFEVDITEEDEQNIEQLTERYFKIKKRLDNYGEINPMAVEAYDEIVQRFENMESQRDDIIDARTSLEATIAEIDGEATNMFLESFHKVKDNFKEVFRSLFSSEDDCDLVLFNPENPLESNIEIVAKPKGKRPKVLSQLSGGEKTLTATALLFSLYLLKPAPFCIFDEVDAPLDDVNTLKFSKLIRRFADDSQFIIITHNKSTMAAMDILYGVYMQEQGISGITKVDFREYEHNEVFQQANIS